MNATDPHHSGGLVSFGDCLIDPGELTRGEAIAAISEHHSCPPHCLPKGRAGATFAAVDGTAGYTDPEWINTMANLCWEALRLTGQRSDTHATPVSLADDPVGAYRSRVTSREPGPAH